MLTFLSPPLLCLLTFPLENIYSEPKFPLGTVQPGIVPPPNPLESQTKSHSEHRANFGGFPNVLKT